LQTDARVPQAAAAAIPTPLPVAPATEPRAKGVATEMTDGKHSAFEHDSEKAAPHTAGLSGGGARDRARTGHVEKEELGTARGSRCSKQGVGPGIMDGTGWQGDKRYEVAAHGVHGVDGCVNPPRVTSQDAGSKEGRASNHHEHAAAAHPAHTTPAPHAATPQTPMGIEGANAAEARFGGAQVAAVSELLSPAQGRKPERIREAEAPEPRYDGAPANNSGVPVFELPPGPGVIILGP
jgi:hypothetical protein